jgi:hypothetical protein
MLAQRFRKGHAAFHFGLDVKNQGLDLRFAIAVAHHIQGLHHGNAGRQHGADLAGEQHDVLGDDRVAKVNSGAAFFLTLSGKMPCRRSSALIMFWLGPRISPLIRTPRLSVPSHLKVGSSSFFLVFFSVGCLAMSVSPSLPG